MPAIEVSGLVKDYPLERGLASMLRHPLRQPTKRVLDGLDLTVDEGEAVAILGPNGAGKTTLLKTIATLVRPTEGKVSVCGHDAVDDEKAVRKLVAYAFSEERSFYWRLTGEQNLEFFAALSDLHGSEARRRIKALGEQFDLTQYMGQRFASYSTGTRQRFALARALLRRARVLLLDEPTRSVDAGESRRIWSLIRGTLVGDEGMTVVLVTHQAEEAAVACDRIAVLDRGRVQSQMRPAQLQTAVSGLHGVTITTEGLPQAALPRLRGVTGVRGLTLSLNEGMQQLDVWCDNGDLALAELIAAITTTGATVRGLVRGAPISEVVERLFQETVST